MSELELPSEQLEQAEALREGSDRKVGLLISMIAVVLAIVAALGNKADNDEIINRVNASNTWAYYQAKKIRGTQTELSRDLVSLIPASTPNAAKLLQKYEENLVRYQSEQNEISEKAKSYEKEAEHSEHKGNWFDIAEVLLQISLVMCSVTILTRQSLFFKMGLAFATSGALLAVLAHLPGLIKP